MDVVRIFQPCAVELARGEQRVALRLLGVDCPRRGDRGLLGRALDHTRKALGSGSITLLKPEVRDRGELVGVLRLRNASTLAELVLEAGLGFYDPAGVPQPYGETLLRAQERAHAAERGIWDLPMRETKDLADLEGQIVTICADALASQKQPDDSWHVYLGDYPHRKVAVRIPAEYVSIFESPSVAYTRQEVCATGRVEPGAFLPEIVVTHPMQLEARGLGKSF